MLEFFNKNPKITLAIIIILIGITPGIKVFELLTPSQSKTVLNKIIDEAVERSLTKHLDQIFNSDYEYPVTLLALAFGDFKTAGEVEKQVKFYYDNNWDAQIAAMKVVARNDIAATKLSKMLYDEKFVKIILKDFK